MRIGRLDKLITIEAAVVSGVSESNEPIQTWTPYRQCWAEAYDVRSQEVWSEEDKVRLAQTTTRFRIHFRDAAGISSAMRVSYDGRLYDIKSVILDHVRKQSATIDAVARDVTVSGSGLQAVISLPDSAVVDDVYQATISILGGTAPFNVIVAPGSPIYMLPPGLYLAQASETTWSLEGYPEEAGTWPVSLLITDSDNNTAIIDPFQITISS